MVRIVLLDGHFGILLVPKKVLLNGLTCALLELRFECTDHVAVIKVGSLFSVHRSGILLVGLPWLWSSKVPCRTETASSSFSHAEPWWSLIGLQSSLCYNRNDSFAAVPSKSQITSSLLHLSPSRSAFESSLIKIQALRAWTLVKARGRPRLQLSLVRYRCNKR